MKMYPAAFFFAAISIRLCDETRNGTNQWTKMPLAIRSDTASRATCMAWELEAMAEKKFVISLHRIENHNEEISAENTHTHRIFFALDANFFCLCSLHSLLLVFEPWVSYGRRVHRFQTQSWKSIFLLGLHGIAILCVCVQSLAESSKWLAIRCRLVSVCRVYTHFEAERSFFALRITLLCLALCILHVESVAFDCVCSSVEIDLEWERGMSGFLHSRKRSMWNQTKKGHS